MSFTQSFSCIPFHSYRAWRIWCSQINVAVRTYILSQNRRKWRWWWRKKTNHSSRIDFVGSGSAKTVRDPISWFFVYFGVRFGIFFLNFFGYCNQFSFEKVIFCLFSRAKIENLKCTDCCDNTRMKRINGSVILLFSFSIQFFFALFLQFRHMIWMCDLLHGHWRSR